MNTLPMPNDKTKIDFGKINKSTVNPMPDKRREMYLQRIKQASEMSSGGKLTDIFVRDFRWQS